MDSIFGMCVLWPNLNFYIKLETDKYKLGYSDSDFLLGFSDIGKNPKSGKFVYAQINLSDGTDFDDLRSELFFNCKFRKRLTILNF